MNKKLVCMLLILAMLFAISACGGESASTAATPLPSSEPDNSWGVQVEAETQMEASVENEFGMLDVSPPPQDDAVTADLKEVLMPLVMCDFADGMHFDPTDSQFFWRAMNYYAASVCYQYGAVSEDMSWAVYSEDQIYYFAKRLFGGVEELPALLDTGMIEKRESGEYAFGLGDFGDVLLELGEIKPSGEDYSVEAKLTSSEGEDFGTWTFRLSVIGEEYCVTGIVYG